MSESINYLTASAAAKNPSLVELFGGAGGLRLWEAVKQGKVTVCFARDPKTILLKYQGFRSNMHEFTAQDALNPHYPTACRGSEKLIIRLHHTDDTPAVGGMGDVDIHVANLERENARLRAATQHLYAALQTAFRALTDAAAWSSDADNAAMEAGDVLTEYVNQVDMTGWTE